MIDEHDVREMLRRRANAVPTAGLDAPVAVRRGRRRLLATGVVAVLAAATIAVVTFAGVSAIRNAPIPADPPDGSAHLGIFAPVAGRILSATDDNWWGVDPNSPVDTEQGPGVADDVVARLVPLDLGDAGTCVPPRCEPLGWSSDGADLLLMRSVGDLEAFPEQTLSIVHADGTETLLTANPIGISDATISPDGTRVVFAGQYDLSGLYVVDAAGGEPVRLREEGGAPSFSPDGRQIVYLAGNRGAEVWVADADGTDAHRILADAPIDLRGTSGPEWSPAGDRVAIGAGEDEGSAALAIYTFAPDGSDLTRVIVGGTSPHWSPDGSRIAYTIVCEEQPTPTCPEGSIIRSQYDAEPDLFGGGAAGLAIADADGSNVREFGFAAAGAWHPSVPATETPMPSPIETPPSAASEVLTFTGGDGRGDLVAVDAATGDRRVLAEDIKRVSNARWSADGRWVAFEMDGAVWVVDPTLERREIEGPSFDGDWAWSSTGAQLAMFRESGGLGEPTLYVVDPSTGAESELTTIDEDPANVFTPALSPDGTRILFGVRGGAVYSVDVRTGERSLFVQLRGENLDSIDRIVWSPDGSRIAIVHNDEDLFIVNDDGSDVRALDDSERVFGFDWSPDGSRIAWTEDHGGEFHVLVAPADGAAGSGSLVGSVTDAGVYPVWSPDGSRIALGHRNAYLSDDDEVTVIDVDGSSDPGTIDDLTYESWRGGSYDCDCDLFG